MDSYFVVRPLISRKLPKYKAEHKRKLFMKELKELVGENGKVFEDGLVTVAQLFPQADLNAFIEFLSNSSKVESFSKAIKAERSLDGIMNALETVLPSSEEYSSFSLSHSGQYGKLSFNGKELHSTIVEFLGEKSGFAFVRKPSDDTFGVTVNTGDVNSWVSCEQYEGAEIDPVIPQPTMLVLASYAELHMKKGNKAAMIRGLVENIQKKLGSKCKTVRREDFRITVMPAAGADVYEVLQDVAAIPGIATASPACRFPNNIDTTVAESVKLLKAKSFSTLSVKVKLYNKEAFSSAQWVRNHILTAVEENFPTAQVINNDGDILLRVFICDRYTYCTVEKAAGVGGIPVQSENTVVSLLSGGIDSPVASYLMMKRGCPTVFVHFQNGSQMTSAVRDKIEKIAQQLSHYQTRTTLYVVPFEELQQEIIVGVKPSMRMLCYRQAMLRIAARVAKKHDAPFLITGDSMNQVASQTIRNLQAVYLSSPLPILSPLIGMNKQEITDIAKQIGTFELSSLPYGDCCSYFIAEHPELRAKPSELQTINNSLVNSQRLEEEALAAAQILRIVDGEVTVVRAMSATHPDELPRVKAGEFVQLCKIPPKENEEAVAEPRQMEVEEEEKDKKSVFKRPRPGVDNAADTPKKVKEAEPARVVYLDNSATTPCCDEALAKMSPYMNQYYGNPASIHSHGAQSARALEAARAYIASTLGASQSQICFNAGGTEGNNTVVKGIVLNPKYAGRNDYVTCAIEHDSVHVIADELKKANVNVTVLPVDAEGRVSPDALAAALTPRTALVSIIHGSNEIGTVQNLAALGAICRKNNVLFHVDAVQSYTKIPIDVNEMCIDFLTLSAHKIHGPKGVGALYVRDAHSSHLYPLLHGGGQETGLRSGTVNVPGAVGFAAAARAAFRESAAVGPMRTLTQQLLAGIRTVYPDVLLNGPEMGDDRLPHHLSVTFSPKIAGERIVSFLSRQGVCCSTGSACSSADPKPSHALLAISRTVKQALSTVRFSLSRDTTPADIKQALDALQQFKDSVVL
eukprot:GCRY01000766.1.p1 GENE.GCRY01000766.1~~GCRY01000766.1.p1  ORF type:complete len:1029 (+),score=335.57 GCRY01000766.1:168-3254(+)